MKNKVLWMMAFFVFILLLSGKSIAIAAEKKIAVGVNDKLIEFPDAAPSISDSTAYVPIVPFAEAIGASITYDSSNQTLQVSKGERWILFSIAEHTLVNSDGMNHKASIFIKDKRTQAPVRLLGEFFGYRVDYLSQNNTVRLVNGKHTTSHNGFVQLNRKKLFEYFNGKTSNKDNVVPKGKRKVYLTFDDGPNIYTPKILSILKTKQALATFFMLEPNMRKYPSTVNQLVNEGHYPALHSVTHDKNKLYMGQPQNVALEMETARKTLFNLTGVNSKLTRVPYGSKPYMKQPYRDSLAKYGFKMWDWHIDTLDWKYQSNNPRQIVANVRLGMEKLALKQDKVVILFHDSKGTASVLSEIIDYIHYKGFQLEVYDPNEHHVVNYWNDSRL
ncbi:polysaccharide deacetylase family protein [Cytobacillus spongiae]|uniref:polysaccharide deacetylase family protein n=1 Tax=Cytobacillus spongiae TaxID=2901381 RepID=UPI001F4503AA|nr:polysaccharide deacetylase family protein [Cytobacillus spongiae]UII55636.1 polysaccharide deacetylase family protein [Cytobacillus spongiae]